MAPLPPNSTDRFFLDYSDGVNSHTISWRWQLISQTISDAMDACHAFLLAIEPKLYLITVLGARVQLQGESVSVPTGWTGDTTYGSGAMPAVNAPRELRFQGRSGSGRRVSVSVYGGNFSTPATYRIVAGADADFDAGIAQLILAADIGSWIAIDGLGPLVYTFVSVNFNSYWEEQARP